MPGLCLYTGNHLESLVARLADLVRNPVSHSPFDPEIIVVQSRGMQQWIAMELARRNTVCANVRFPFPNAFLHDTAAHLFPELPPLSDSDFDADVMTFRILDGLSELATKPGFEPLAAYLADDGDRLKSLQLARQIADLFDQYQVFRPDMITAWETGQDAFWQAELWRFLCGSGSGWHRTRVQQHLRETIETGAAVRAALPGRVSIFGISYLPPFHLELLELLSRVMTIHLFALNPCREYWADIVERREMDRRAGPVMVPGDRREALHLEEGNRLLAAMGGLGRDFFALLHDMDPDHLEECFEDIPRQHRLGQIQSDILDLHDRTAETVELAIPMDGSLQIHNCHSPMREIEVLHDQLLAMFEADATLMPREVVVMTPDIDRIAPFVHAVFGSQGDDRLRIPYTVSDRSARQESRLVDGLLELLQVKGSRFTATDVLALLECAPIRRKFDLSASDIDAIQEWIRESGIRWGKNGAARADLGLPPFEENTWQAGLQRLMLGYAMPGEERDLFHGILPYDAVDGSDSRLLGCLLEFTDRLFRFEALLHGARPPHQWATLLADTLDRFVAPVEDEMPERQLFRDVLEDWRRKSKIAGFHDAIPFEPVRYWLAERIGQRQSQSGFLSGGVTFCAMLPMRSIPFRVVCLIGMNSDAFPRDSKQPEFDLMARHPRRGDRSRREDDRYLFLEALVSARDCLYISYVGQCIEDNAHMPPSVLVSQLLDYLHDGFGCPESAVVIRHPLQAFSPMYFQDDPHRFSYSRENADAAIALQKPRRRQPFVTAELPMPAESEAYRHHIGIDDLVRFFSNPARFLLQRRLGVFFHRDVGPVEDAEMFDLDPLSRYRIGSDVIHHHIRGVPIRDRLAIHRAAGRLPHGSAGDNARRRLEMDSNAFLQRLEPYTASPPLPDLDIEQRIGRVTIQGRLDGMTHGQRVVYRFAKTRAVDLVTVWIEHLLLGLASSEGYPSDTVLIGRDHTWHLNPVPEPEPILAHLMELFYTGLSRPLPFFAEAGLVYSRGLGGDGADPDTALKKARFTFSGNDFMAGAAADPYIRTCFSHTDPIDAEFARISSDVFTPLLAVCRRMG